MSAGALLLLLLLAAAPALAWWAGRRRRLRCMPPGRLGLPLLGETLSLIAAYKSERPEPFVDERVRRHGSRVFTTHIFGEATVFSADAEFNRTLLAAEGRAVECSYPSSISTLLGRHSLLLMRGQAHRRLHSLTLNRLASPAAIGRGQGQGLLMPQIDWLVRETMAGWPEAPKTVRLQEETKRITFDLMVKQLVSIDAGEWTEALRREYMVLIDGFFAVPLPSFLPFTVYGRALRARKKVADGLREVIRQRKEMRNARMELEQWPEASDEKAGADGNSWRYKDMLDELLEAEVCSLSEEEVVDFLLAMLVAGYETTSTIMTFAVKFLTENPAALAALKEEHESIRARKRDDKEPLNWSDYKSMPFTQCVINETLRVANNISGVFRRAISDIQYKGYTIPKGCKLFVSFRAVHLDNEHFDNARTFNPWRWQNNDANHNSVGSNIFTPFGGGPRLCPGYELARVIISVFLHHLVTHYSWDAAEEDRLVFFPTTRTVKGYPIIVCRRQ